MHSLVLVRGMSSGDFKQIGEIGSGIAGGLNAAIRGMSITMDTIKEWFGGINWGELGITVRQAILCGVCWVDGL